MPHLPRRRPDRGVSRTLGLGLSALVAAALIVGAPAAASAWNQGSAEATLWQLLNGARANNGVRVLQQQSTLIGLARWRSSDMLAKSYFSHTIAGCGCLVYTYYDGNGLQYKWAGENIAWNSGLPDSTSPVRAHEAFMASPGHRANVLDPRFTHAGVGAAAADNKMFLGHVQNTRMYTELFMEASISAPAPAPAPPPSGGSGGGASGGGSGGGAGAQAAYVQPQPKAKPKPKAKHVRVDAPRRPVSTAGLDGTRTLVSAPRSFDLASRLRVDEVAAARAASMTAAMTPKEPVVAVAHGEMEIEAAGTPPGGLLEGVVGAVLGFLFG
jgi:uncharacterized protein YkwD